MLKALGPKAKPAKAKGKAKGKKATSCTGSGCEGSDEREDASAKRVKKEI